MSGTLKIAAVVVAIVILLTLAVTGTVYAFTARHCGSGNSSCIQQHLDGGCGAGRCEQSGSCNEESRCDAGSRP